MSDVNIVIDKDSLSKKEEEKAAEQRKQQTKDLFEQSIEEALLEKRVFLTSSPAQDLIFILKYYHVGCCLLWNHDNDLYKKSERLVVFACTIIWSMFASIVAHTFDLDIAKGDSAVGWVFLFAFFITFWRFLLLLIATCAQNDFCFDFCGCLPRGLFKNFGTGVLCTLSIGSLLFVLITMSLPQSPDKDLATTQWFYSLLVSLTIYETLIWILWFFIRRPQEEKKFLTPAFTFTNKDENKNNWLKNPFAQITVRKSPVEGAVVLHLETLEGQKNEMKGMNHGHRKYSGQAELLFQGIVEDSKDPNHDDLDNGIMVVDTESDGKDGAKPYASDMRVYWNIDEALVFPDDKLRGAYHSWEFNVWDYSLKDLLICCKGMLRDVGAIDMIKAPMPVLDEFLNTIPDHYFNNPYHNVRHGVGVMQGVFCIIRSMGGDKYLTPHDQIWALLGALGHDIGHPGVSNNFLINTNNTIAQLYNSVSVLENFHAAETIRLLTRTETNIFQNLSKSKQAQAKHFIREVILATDMARHFHFIGQFKQKMGGTPRRNREKIPVKDRVMFAQMVLKTADIGNAGKTWDESIVWNTLIAEEFYRQGDKEVQLGFTPEPLYTRGAMSSTASSMFFMNNLAKPLFRTIESVLPQTKQLLDRLNTNYTQLSQKLADEKSGAGEAAAEGDAAEGENGAVTVTRVRVNKRKTIVFGAQTTNLLGQTAAPPLNAPTTTTE